MYAEDPETALRTLRRDLEAPPITVSPESLLAAWETDVVRFVCERPAVFEDFPDFSVRMRGALGSALERIGPQTDWRGRRAPRAYEALFSPVARAPNGDEIPRPAIVRASAARSTIVVDVILIGASAWWISDAEEAMTFALEHGVSLKGSGVTRVRLAICTRERRKLFPEPPAPNTSMLALRFRSPVAVRHRDVLAEEPESIVWAVVRRVESLAAWQYCTVPRPPGLSEEIAQLSLDHRDLAIHRWSRFSRRGGDREIPMAGHLGTLRITGRMRLFPLYAAIGATCNVGSHASIGLGWYDLSSYA